MTCSVERVAMPNYCRGSVAAFGVAHTSANFTTPGPISLSVGIVFK